MSKELDALETIRKSKYVPDSFLIKDYKLIETALLKYEKLCKVINNFYDMAHGKDGVRYKFDSHTIAYFSYKLKQLIDNPYEENKDD